MKQNRKKIYLETESGERVGTTLLKEGKGFTGTGYVGGFEAANTALRFHNVVATAGIYEARVRYRAPGEKGLDFVVNGKKISAHVPGSPDTFTWQALGKVELRAGANELAIERGWGYYQIDALEFVPAAPPAPLRSLKPTLVDKKATPEARRLMTTLVGQYGKKVFSGQQNQSDVAYIQKNTGLVSAIVSVDLMDYSPSRVAHGARPQGTTEQMIVAARAGQMLSVMWHWNAPKDLLDKRYKNDRGQEIDASWYKGFYTNATTFDVAKALANPQSEDYKLLLSDIDVIATELKKLQDARIPVLWRPLHEAEGGWFWWGAKGPEAFKKLWRLLYDRLTNHHNLHHLIWVYTAGGKQDWYPGDSVVDIVGTDAYPSDGSDPLTGIWETLLAQFNGKKLLALTEFGGVPDVERMQKFGVRWSYFVSWGGDLGPKKVSTEELKRLYSQKAVRNKQ
jgi:mannan endo-1,4-beta-mannosidase